MVNPVLQGSYEPAPATMTISSDERAFFVALGERIATLRKARNLTQTHLAEALGVSQQTVQSYEVGLSDCGAGALRRNRRLKK